jgi:hypothetical protein
VHLLCFPKYMVCRAWGCIGDDKAKTGLGYCTSIPAVDQNLFAFGCGILLQ